MYNAARLAAVLALAFAGGCGPPPVEIPVDPAAALRSSIARYDSAWGSKDTATVAGALAPDYVYFTSTGGQSDRARTLGFLADTSYAMQSQERTELDISIVGGVARAASRWRGQGRYRGEIVDDDQTCVQYWRDVGGHWAMFSEQCVNRTRPDSAGSASPP
jgi:hypothetical protein